ncbi:c-type cytochrome [Pseudomonas lurida]|jgi:cytochrome c553|uniref:C-type cytochrome n=1 Tax=Pseudomonas quebecensis TaxID=2995174 RepID=A0ABY6QN63_9PSED|nr:MULTISPECIES: c-type cytochrome [Pseudomonas]MBA1293166.1 c-type cytochrome [Pseudomonas lurida]MCP1511231.1 cytochrome c553 [Pseudomonas rhodesiae]MCX4067489.1 c-type cytochrome [Pseudomonas quebecensis]MDF9770051.1 cytochrome c553 [Pseudomonas rhodesiae]UZW20931.1 c-type cytochrome [Pseudomonas quebecensis]
MRPLQRTLVGSALFFLLGSAHALDGSKIFTEGGAQPAAMACVACHGADGGGVAAAGFPRLAGLPAAYLRKQLEDFKRGSRDNPVMRPLAIALTDAEVQALSQTIAAMPAAAPVPVYRSEMPTNAAQKLALQGAWERQIPACVSCHGPAGSGVGDTFPPLAGQPAGYLAAQLIAWQNGTRHNDVNDLMGPIAKSLTAQEAQDVAQYFASLSLEVKP